MLGLQGGKTVEEQAAAAAGNDAGLLDPDNPKRIRRRIEVDRGGAKEVREASAAAGAAARPLEHGRVAAPSPLKLGGRAAPLFASRGAGYRSGQGSVSLASPLDCFFRLRATSAVLFPRRALPLPSSFLPPLACRSKPQMIYVDSNKVRIIKAWGFGIPPRETDGAVVIEGKRHVNVAGLLKNREKGRRGPRPGRPRAEPAPGSKPRGRPRGRKRLEEEEDEIEYMDNTEEEDEEVELTEEEAEEAGLVLEGEERAACHMALLSRR